MCFNVKQHNAELYNCIGFKDRFSYSIIILYVIFEGSSAKGTFILTSLALWQESHSDFYFEITVGKKATASFILKSHWDWGGITTETFILKSHWH